jgi:hypothetical protein
MTILAFIVGMIFGGLLLAAILEEFGDSVA